MQIAFSNELVNDGKVRNLNVIVHVVEEVIVHTLVRYVNIFKAVVAPLALKKW